MMGVLNEDSRISLKRRIHNIDEQIPLEVLKIKEWTNICKFTVDNYVDAVASNTIDKMYWYFFSDIDYGSEEWVKMYDAMEKYIIDKFGQDLRVDWQIICLMPETK